ncbi:MAG: ComEC/Rec2 family competence protein [Candidatus Riflebacteria bacterium]|nr:ComEC/Rec2 family competence protein [Candidatus Riflebacteria bacterium]
MKKKKKKEPRIYKSKPEVLPIFVAVFIVGILLSELFSSDLYIVWFGISLSTILLSFFIKSEKAVTISLIISSLSASMFFGAIRNKPNWNNSDLLVLDNTSGTLYGRYTGESTILNKNKISYVFTETSYSDAHQTVDIPIKVNCHGIINRQRLYPEQYYAMTGKLRIVSFDKAPIFEIASFTQIELKLPSIMTTAKEFQQKIKSSLASVLKKEHSAIVTGFLLGDTSRITDKRIFVETGISHILAVSGQHIMIIILFVASILHWFKIPPISRCVSIALILSFYAMVTVGSPSVWRALIMYLSISTIFLLESASSPIRPVSIAAFIMLIYDPSLLHNASFILSFTAVLSIIYLSPLFKFLLDILHLPESISRYLAVTFAANIGIMPMGAYIFGTVSISSLFVNPLILWTFTFILPLGFIIAFLSIFSISTVLLNSGFSILLDTLISFLEYVRDIPGMYFYVGNISSFTILIIYSAMLFLVSIFNRWQKKYILSIIRKPALEKIPTTNLPSKKTAEIVIDKNSKAIHTLLGKNDVQNKKLKEAVNKPSNPLKNSDIVEAIDEMISGLKRIKIDNQEIAEELIPVNNLNIDSQNLYYRLLNMDENLFLKEPERLLQAHVFMLAIPGYELLNRINSNLDAPISNDLLLIDYKVNDRYLAVAILADSIMNSNVSERITDSQLKEIVKQGQSLFLDAQKLLQQTLDDKNFEASIQQHIILRKEIIKWCWHFVKYDNILKLRKKKNFR